MLVSLGSRRISMTLADYATLSEGATLQQFSERWQPFNLRSEEYSRKILRITYILIHSAQVSACKKRGFKNKAPIVSE